ncbi:MAG TPA: DUF3006 domain-containing protein [Clostridia bacterium]|jgi:hypothetical protein|nr:DUF3006 domain-containing protein [Clostridia bacterium]
MKAIVQSIENEYAVLLVGENEIKVNLPIALLPKGVIVGDVINFLVTTDREESYQEKNEMVEKLIRIFQHEQNE